MYYSGLSCGLVIYWFLGWKFEFIFEGFGMSLIKLSFVFGIEDWIILGWFLGNFFIGVGL